MNDCMSYLSLIWQRVLVFWGSLLNHNIHSKCCDGVVEPFAVCIEYSLIDITQSQHQIQPTQLHYSMLSSISTTHYKSN